jgi:predicted CxxxxCH...CXXCH cytochrome family protein
LIAVMLDRASSRLILAALAVPLLLAAGCDAARQIAPPPGGQSATVSACTGCHGDAARTEADPLVNAAPPVSPSGLANDPGVGAHLAHLHAGPLAGPVDCSECHAPPTNPNHANGTVDFTWGPLATRFGATPSFSAANLSCATTYCHGTTLSGGSNKQPTWTGGPSQAACGTCHGAPPPNHAATSTHCATCHPGTANDDGTINVAGGLHVNGSIEALGGHAPGWADPTQHGYAANSGGLSGCKACHGAALDGGTSGISCASCHGAGWQSNCTFCHGTRTTGWTSAQLNLAAPPAGTQGQTASSSRAVGAHQRHLAGGSIGNALACTECHLVPADLGHMNGVATITFGAGAKRGGATPSWTGVGCQATYCHGTTLSGGSQTSPVWTGGASQAACGTCHGIAPPTGKHALHSGRSCGDCHPGYASTSVNLATHIDGQKQVGNQITAWNATTRACTGCHGSDTW